MERIERLARPKSRERVLSDPELKRVWGACQELGVFGKIVRLCILLGSGAPRSPIWNWSWVNEDDKTITLPAELTKNSRQHTFPFGYMTAAILATLPEGKYLFPARKTWRKCGTVYNAWNKDKPKLDTVSAVTDWVLHDLRRTLVSSWAALGTRLEVTEKYINHISGSHGGIIGAIIVTVPKPGGVGYDRAGSKPRARSQMGHQRCRGSRVGADCRYGSQH
jgi:integrase